MSASGPDMSAVKRALVEIRELRARVAELEGTTREPIAIVGIGLRVPGGVHDLSSFADQLWSGVDAISPIPGERWSLDEWYDEAQDAPGKMTTRFGGFLSEVDRFDAEFFGISPLEAASMDPQQRLVLELAWEALEDAGHSPAALAGSRTGVYLGIANSDYGRALFAHPEAIDPYFSPGTSFSVASGRLSYLLGFHGPAVSLDTACSSSLVATHLACQALRGGECDMAIAGGVNLILTPELNVNFSKSGMMARDGRCKTFDAAADGYVRGEGGAMIVLRRLRDALADGNRVLAVIRGSAVNQDGRSNGLTAPNGPAQEAVLRAALQSAGIAPGLIGYVEAHGTGTPLGDPIEVNALAAVLSEGRDVPLMIGSVKTNVGHLEAAAGVVGLAKTILALQRREIPPHLHLQNLNPYIDWASKPIRVPTIPTPWAPIGGRRLAGVSSFGFSGTNAHIILEEAPPAEGSAPQAAERPTQILTVSARDPQTLKQLAGAYAQELSLAGQGSARLGDICFTANAGRSHFAHRLSLTGNEIGEMARSLAAFARGENASATLVAGEMPAQPPRVAFLFPGQGPQYIGMARDLYDSAPAFREAFDACAKALDALLDRPLTSLIWPASGESSPLNETAYAQPAMFAIEVSLAALWRSWGVEPVAVMGHSFGEYAAACIAGAIPLEDAARMVAARGRLVQALPRDGAMTVLEASEADVNAAIRTHGGRVSIAAINGATNTVISGERTVVDKIAQQFAVAGARTKALRVSHAFHSPLIESVLDAFEREVSDVRFAEPRCTLISNLSGRVADLALIGKPSYWRRHMRDSVRFADSIRAMATHGITHYIEMSPHPVLLGMGSECVEGGQWLPSLREGKPAWSTMLESLQQLYVAGLEVDWRAFDRGMDRRRVKLPTYPFRRKRHWLDIVGAPRAAQVSAAVRWQRLTDSMDRQATRGPLDLNAASYPAKWDCLARLTRAYAIRTFSESGLFAKQGERHTLESVMSAAGIRPPYRHLMQRWLESLVEVGVLSTEGSDFVARQPLPNPGLEALWREAEALFADNTQLLDYVRNCASIVGPVLRGHESALETLFPGGSFDLAQALYERSTAMRYINALAGAAFEAVVSATPPGRRLQVLEIGAGTGGTTSSLLPLFSRDNARYLFTDVSDVFLERARTRFGDLGFVEFGLFDLDKDFTEQGFKPGSFDVIVSANCVHAVKDLRAALERLRLLLAPGGVLVLVESTTHLAYFDMTTGLIEGWQHFADDLRGDNPLLKPPVWIGALEKAGFTEARAWPPENGVADGIAQHVIVARAPGETAASAAQAGNASTAVAAGGERQAIASADAAAQEWMQQFEVAVPAERLDLMREMVRSTVMRILRLDESSPPARHERLMDLGMDSLMAVQLRNGLSKALGLKRALSSTLMFDYPTIDAIAEHLIERVSAPATLAAAANDSANGSQPIERLDEAAVAAMSDDEIMKLLDKRLGAT